MDQGLVKIILASISLLGASVTYVLVPFIKAKTTKTQQETILTLADISIYAAEEMFKYKDKSGKEKHELVAEFLMKKFKLSREETDILIKALVKEMNIVKSTVV